jgi:amino acid permease
MVDIWRPFPPNVWLPPASCRSGHQISNPALWLVLFLPRPILFNMVNVRRYGEIEFWQRTIKATAVVGVVGPGILFPMGASRTIN